MPALRRPLPCPCAVAMCRRANAATLQFPEPMTMTLKSRVSMIVAAISAVLLVAGCSVPADSDRGGIHDPHETTNRGVHGFNVGLDRALFRPAGRAYTKIVPDPIEDSFNHFAHNISKPGDVVNFLLQGRVKEAGISLARFVVNTTVGFAGLADPATEFGIPAQSTDFGETLHVWGAKEGAYIELPVLGPSTERDAVGRVVDIFTNPLGYTGPIGDEHIRVYTYALDSLSKRGRYSSTVDSVLYESADSYAAARSVYLQNRRYKLEGTGEDSYIDPYDDPYENFDADTGSTIDPYEDPYAD